MRNLFPQIRRHRSQRCAAAYAIGCAGPRSASLWSRPAHTSTLWLAGPSSAEIAQLLHIDLPKPGNKSFWQLAQYFPGCGVGMKFYRKVRALPRALRRRSCWTVPRMRQVLSACVCVRVALRAAQTWRMDEGGCYWEVTRVKQKVDNTGKYPDETPHGKAWGIMTWNGTLLCPSCLLLPAHARAPPRSSRARALAHCGRVVLLPSLSSRCVGETDGREREVRGTYKKVWKYLPPE